TPYLLPKPSISTNNRVIVSSGSSFPPINKFLPRARPQASIPSIQILHGPLSLACLKRARTRDAPTPTIISTKSDPDKEKNGTCACPATAFAYNVLPVPGGPTNKAPFGILPPRSVYFFGFFRKSTISITSVLASSKPATSLNVMFIWLSLSKSCALDFPILKIAPPPAPAPPPIRLINNIHMATIMSNGSINEINQPAQGLDRFS